MTPARWWEQALVYQIYVRSFQDSNGDGIGDLPGVTRRLGHVASVGADAIWLSPIYPSPNADFGYDVTDYTSVEPSLGDLSDLDDLVSAAHALGLKVLLDFVPCHTSIQHPWFREHPDYYIWADAPVNNWVASFGGSAWERDPKSGRFYLHSFFPEQADLDWRNPAVRAEIAEALRFWQARGIDGFRLDALDRLMKDPELRDDPPARGPAALPSHAADEALEHAHSRDAPDIDDALATIRAATGEETYLVGEVYLPTDRLQPYLRTLDTVFSFETMHAGADVPRLRAAIAAALSTGGKAGWILSNHDFSRLASRAGQQNARALTLLLLTLPGPAFMLQGDELGLADAQAGSAPLDRFGRDAFRTPMPWDSSAHRGFTTGEPWLPVAAAPGADVAAQQHDAGSMLSLVRRASALRAQLQQVPGRLLPAPEGTVVVARGEHLVAVNLGERPATVPVPRWNEVALEARPGDGQAVPQIPPGGGWVTKVYR